jgi:hypothetical protein
MLRIQYGKIQIPFGGIETFLIFLFLFNSLIFIYLNVKYMNIKELKRIKKNQTLVLNLGEFVFSKELKPDFHMNFKRVRKLNRRSAAE